MKSEPAAPTVAVQKEAVKEAVKIAAPIVENIKQTVAKPPQKEQDLLSIISKE
jgi:hypothetical protein